VILDRRHEIHGTLAVADGDVLARILLQVCGDGFRIVFRGVYAADAQQLRLEMVDGREVFEPLLKSVDLTLLEAMRENAADDKHAPVAGDLGGWFRLMRGQSFEVLGTVPPRRLRGLVDMSQRRAERLRELRRGVDNRLAERRGRDAPEGIIDERSHAAGVRTCDEDQYAAYVRQPAHRNEAILSEGGRTASDACVRIG
jgi:hypothetical protein